MTSGGGRVGALLLADGEPWERTVLGELAGSPAVAVVRRCLDTTDLMAAATIGEAAVALVAAEAAGLDGAAVDHLRRHGLAVVVVADDGVATVRGVAHVLTPDLVDLVPVLTRVVAQAGARPTPPPGAGGTGPPRSRAEDVPVPPGTAAEAGRGEQGRVVAVWGPGGAPGRTTLALGLAAELAHRRRPVLLVDADPWGGTVAQHLGVLDEVSGLLAASRAAATGALDDARVASLSLTVGGRLRVLTGLPRPDRWPEVGAGVVEAVCRSARVAGDVVVDTGAGLEVEAGAWASGPGRDATSLEAIEVADEVVLVGAADPVGLSRLVRAAAELHDVRPAGADRVVLNRVRSSLGWTSAELVALVADAVPGRPVHLLPDDRTSVDRALREGALLTEVGTGALRRALVEVVDQLHTRAGGPDEPVSRRTAARARRG